MKKLFLFIFILSAFTLSYSQTGFRIKLIKNLNPHNLNSNLGYSALWGYTAPDGREYALLGCYSGTSFIDITDTANIREVDFLTSPFGSASSWREMKTYSHYAYIVSESIDSKIQIVDLQYLPDSVRYIGQSDIPYHSSTHSISQSGPYLYLNGCNPGLTQGTAVVDLSNPEVPVLRGQWNDIYVHDLRIINDTIWACHIFDGKVSVIDALNKDSLKFVRSWVNNPLPNSPHNIAFTNNRNYAFVTNEIGTALAPGNLKIWDVSDLEDITLVNIYNPYPFVSSVAHNVEIYNNYAFVAYYSAGLKVLNISNPANPVETGWYDTYPDDNSFNYVGCWGIYYFPASGKIIASDRKRGLFVLRPDLTLQIPGIPKADFTVAKNQVLKYEDQTFIDMSEGIPASWQWTITGPETHTFNVKNPIVTLNSTGDYDVKLKVTNSFGTDSVVKLNYFSVINMPLLNFQTLNPPGPSFRILTSPSDTEKVLFNWISSANNKDVYYKIYFRKIFSPSEEYILSGNNGRDTSFKVSKSFLDSMAIRLGLTGDSVRIFYKVIAYNEKDSLASSNTVNLTIKRNSTGINSVNDIIPLKYKLYNNYPNPFNPVTNIRFDIPKQSKMKLILYDLTGREVLRFYEKDLAAGSYKYSLNLSNMNSGVYFVRIDAGEFSSVIKIVLIK